MVDDRNLKVTHYRNGDPIPNVTDDATWQGLSTEHIATMITTRCAMEIYMAIYTTGLQLMTAEI